MCVPSKVCLWADRALQTPHHHILVANEDQLRAGQVVWLVNVYDCAALAVPTLVTDVTLLFVCINTVETLQTGD